MRSIKKDRVTTSTLNSGSQVRGSRAAMRASDFGLRAWEMKINNPEPVNLLDQTKTHDPRSH